MTVYSASSIMAVTISAAHGGCGTAHSRPVRNGAPDKIWKLTCPPCEAFLGSDPMWAATMAEIPETHDEKIAREDYETRGAKDRDYVQAIALAKIAGVEIPEALKRALSGDQAHIPSAQVECRDGHPNMPGSKFCGECGVPMQGRAPAGVLAASEPAPVPRAEGSPDLAKMHPQKLRKMCRERGLPDVGRVPELVARLQEAA